MRSLSLFMILVVATLGYADGPGSDRIQFAERAATAEEALAELEQAEQEAKKGYDGTLAEVRKKLDQAKEKYRESVAAAEQKAIADLQHLAKQAVANGDIAAASDRWEAVLRLDEENEEAQKFFKAIGRLDVVAKQIRRARTRSNASSLPESKAFRVVPLNEQQLSGRKMLFYHDPAGWRFEPDGLVRNLASGEVYDNDHAWKVTDKGQLQIITKAGKVTSQFDAIRTDDGLRMIGSYRDGHPLMIVPAQGR